jgi:hypothetical protein
MDPVTMTLNLPNVELTWTAPNNKGSAILSYKFLIYSHTTGTYIEDLTYCDGSFGSAVLTNLYCHIPVTSLISGYGYQPGQLVEAIARATNANGDAQYSSPNTAGAIIVSEPTKMTTPVVGAGLSSTNIQISWTALTGAIDTGNLAITSYNLD